MFVSKSIVYKNLLKIPSINIEHKCSLGLDATKVTSPKPVLMSYASYESTESTTEKRSPLIIMHGLFGSKGNWNSLCKRMQSKSNPSRKIIAVDSRNHGDSPHISSHNYEDMAEDIKYLMETQNIPKAIVLGHSMGGKASMCFALKYPHLVERLIIVDISPVSKSANMGYIYSFLETMQNIKLLPNLNLSTARMEADTYLSKVVTNKGVRAFLLTNLIKKADGSYGWRINIPALLHSVQKIDSFPHFGAVKYEGPTLFIKGALSDYVQQNDIRPIKNMFPNTEFVSISGAGHWVHSEKPTEFVEIVLKFINN